MYFGWYVVGTAFLLALWSSGFGLYGLSVYLPVLREANAWSTSTVSLAITGYYLLGALVMTGLGRAMGRLGTRTVILGGIAAMAGGVGALPFIGAVWQLWVALAAMAVGWATTSNAAINLLLAPWFEQRRGLAVNMAMMGAACGGLIVAPLLIWLIGVYGFRAGVGTALAVLLALLIPTILLTANRAPAERDATTLKSAGAIDAAQAAAPATLRQIFRMARYWTLSLAFAAALMAQIGLLTHLVSYLSPIRGSAGAAWALSVTTASALAGRVVLGLAADRLPLRGAAALVFLVQAAGVLLLMGADRFLSLLLGCILFGIGVGNVVTLPGLLVHREYGAAQFADVLSVVAATNQVAVAFGPALLGLLRDWHGTYEAALVLVASLEVAAAALILAGAARRTAWVAFGRS